MAQYIPVFTYPLALFLQNEGWVIHHTAPNKNDTKRKVYYFNYCPGIYDDMNRFQRTEKITTTQIRSETIYGEPNYLIPIYDRNMVKYLSDLNYKIDHIEVYVSEVDNSKRRVTFFKYKRGFYTGIQKYLNWQDKKNRRKKQRKQGGKVR